LALNLAGVLRNAALAGAILATVICVYVFVRVQILESYPFYNGVYGNQILLPGITYTAGLELFGVLLVVSMFVREVSKAGGTLVARAVRAAGDTLLIVGLVLALVVYAETNFPWGNLLPGVHLWQGFPGGGGYPWGAERVAYNMCFVPSAIKGDCNFLNYDELFWIGLLSALLGFVIKNRTPSGTDEVPVQNSVPFHA